MSNYGFCELILILIIIFMLKDGSKETIFITCIGSCFGVYHHNWIMSSYVEEILFLEEDETQNTVLVNTS